MASGAVVFVSAFEVFNQSGFTLTWWGWLTGRSASLSAFRLHLVSLPETRVMTLAQFFEVRYCKSLRLFAGVSRLFRGRA